jgi:type IV pilus assembly protein PilX
LPAKQRGAVLFVALVFLLLITILATTASSTSVLEERMAGGLRNGQLALMGAETALREGELLARTLAEESVGSAALTFCDAKTTGAANSVLPCVYRADTGAPVPAVASFKSGKSACGIAQPDICAIAMPLSATKRLSPPTPGGATSTTYPLARQPRYIIEWLGYLSDAYPQAGVMSGAQQRQSQQACDGSAPKLGLFRITARSSGGNDASVRVAESVFSAFVTCAYNT